MQPRGLGALQLAFEQLKKKLQAEGLFDAVPQAPAACAAAQDRHRHVARRRGAARHHQGAAPPPSQRAPRDPAGARAGRDGAAAEVARGLRAIARVAGVDVVIVGRGGGSVEDLWAFNEERGRARDRRLPGAGDRRGRTRGGLHDRRLRRRSPRADAFGGGGDGGRGEGRVLHPDRSAVAPARRQRRAASAAAARRRARAGQPARPRRAGRLARDARPSRRGAVVPAGARADDARLQQHERALQALRAGSKRRT